MLATVPARLFVLGDGLTVEVAACTATIWCGQQTLHLLLARGADDTATVVLDADLVAAGLRDRADDGPVTVWPDGGSLCIGLRHSVVELPAGPVADLLDQRASRSARNRSASG